MRLRTITLLSVAAVTLGFATSAHAGTITCPTTGSPNRQMYLGDASSCATGLGNATQTTVNNAFGGSWTNEGTIAGSAGTTGSLTNDLLTTTVVTGSWGNIPASGTWGIDPTFWATWGRAVISVHIGNGGGDPDHWLFEITPGTMSGTWGLAKLSGSGGGLSNMNLWGLGTPDPNFACNGQPCAPAAVPEPASLVLLGTGLAVAAARLRRRKTQQPQV